MLSKKLDKYKNIFNYTKIRLNQNLDEIIMFVD